MPRILASRGVAVQAGSRTRDARTSTSAGLLSQRLSYLHSFASKAQLRSHPFGQPADCVVCLGSAASHHLEAVQHLREHVEPYFDAGLLGSLGKHPAVIDKGLVASGLQEDWRESGKVAVQRACM